MSIENNILIYTTPQGNIHISVRFENDTFWLTQRAMATLFGVEIPAISKHLKNIYSEGELYENATISKMETVVNRGFRGEVLDTLNRLVSLFLDTAELRLQNEEILTLDYWKSETDNLLTFSKKPILEGAGTISHDRMEQKVSQIYSDFDANRKTMEAIEEDEIEQQAIKKLIQKAKKK